MKRTQHPLSLVLFLLICMYVAPASTTNHVFAGYNSPPVTMMADDGIVNVKDYGVVGDGTDETSRVQDAADAAAGGSLYFPGHSGEVYVFAGVNISAGTTVSMGRGAILKLKGMSLPANSPLFNVVGNNVSFYGLRIDGNKANQDVSCPVGQDCHYGECECYQSDDEENVGSGAVFRSGIRMDGGTSGAGYSGLYVESVEFENMFGSAIAVRHASNVTVTKSSNKNSYRELVYAAAGTGTAYGKNYKITNNHVDGVQRYTAYVLDGIAGLNFTNNYTANINRGMKIESGRYVVVANNVYENMNNNTDPNFTNGGGEALALPSLDLGSCGYFLADGTTPDCGLRDITISGNIFRNIGGNVITLLAQADNIKRVSIKDNLVDRTGTVFYGLGTFVNIDATSIANVPEDITIDGNEAYEVALFGVSMDAGTRIKIRNNHFRGRAGTLGGNAVLVVPEPGLPEIRDLEIAGNTFQQFGDNIVALSTDVTVQTTPPWTVYPNLQFRNNFVDSGSNSYNALRANATRTFSSSLATNYFTENTVIDGNTFIGGVRVPHEALYWGNNRVTGIVNGFNGGNLPGNSMALATMRLTATKTIDLPNLASGCGTFTVTVNGARTTDTDVLVTPDATAIAYNQTYTGAVTANNTVTVRRCVFAASDPPSATYTVTVTRNVN